MAWTRSTINYLPVYSETYTLPASATTEYSSVISRFRPTADNTNRYVQFQFKASAVTGTNLDIALYGSDTSAGTVKYLLKDAVVADITDATTVAGLLDINAYPAPYYFLAWTADVNESANTLTVKVIATSEDIA